MMALEEGQISAPTGTVGILPSQHSHIGISQGDHPTTQSHKQFIARGEVVEAAYLVDIHAVGFQVTLLQERIEHLFSLLLLFTFLPAQYGLNLAFGLGCCDKVHPLLGHLLTLGRKDLHLVAALQYITDGLQLVIYLGSYAVGSQECMDGESEVQHGAVGRHRLEISLGCDHKDFTCIEIQLYGIQEIDGVRLWIIQNLLDGVQPLVQFVFAVLGGLPALLVFPVGSKSLLRHLIHAFRAYLYLYPLSCVAHERSMQSLISIGLGMGEPVAEALRVRFIDAACHRIYLEAFGYLVLHPLSREDDAYCQDIIDFLKGDMLVLHLGPDAVGRLDACLYLIMESCLVQAFAYGSGKLVKDGGQVSLHVGQFLLDASVFLGMLITEAEVLQFLLYLIQSEAVGQRCIDIECLSCYLVLLVGQLTAQCAHVMQAVGNLDEYHTDVVAHRQQEFLEGFCLSRSFVTEDTAGDLGQSVGNLCYLGTEDVFYILHRVIGILHHIMEQSGTDAGAAQPYLFAGYLSHSYGMHDIGFARQSAHALMGLPGKVERLLYDLCVLAMT